MAYMHYALGELVNGKVEGWHAKQSLEEAIKQAHTRSIESSVTQCIMIGSGPEDEHGEVEYLVVGGEFYKRNDL